MLSQNDIKKIAELARLHLRPEEMDLYAERLSAILQHFRSLEKVSTDYIEPMYHAVEALPLREDVVVNEVDRESVLMNAPDRFENFFRISKVVESGE